MCTRDLSRDSMITSSSNGFVSALIGVPLEIGVIRNL